MTEEYKDKELVKLARELFVKMNDCEELLEGGIRLDYKYIRLAKYVRDNFNRR